MMFSHFVLLREASHDFQNFCINIKVLHKNQMLTALACFSGILHRDVVLTKRCGNAHPKIGI